MRNEEGRKQRCRGGRGEQELREEGGGKGGVKERGKEGKTPSKASIGEEELLCPPSGRIPRDPAGKVEHSGGRSGIWEAREKRQVWT